MANRSRNSATPDTRSHRTKRLRRASVHLAVTLQSLDLEEEPQLADEVIDALQATDRACELERQSESQP